jgi:hypothetical protein
MSAMADRRDILMFTADRAGVSAIRATLNEEGHRGKQPVMDRCCTGTCERGTGRRVPLRDEWSSLRAPSPTVASLLVWTNLDSDAAGASDVARAAATRQTRQPATGPDECSASR